MTLLRATSVACILLLIINAVNSQGVCRSTITCPKRGVISRVLNNALQMGQLDVEAMIKDRRFTAEFGILQAEFNKLSSDLANGGPVIEGIEETFSTHRVSFIKTLRESCNIAVRSDLKDLIYTSFEEYYERLMVVFKRSGGTIPLCPQRTAIKRFTDQASAENGTIDTTFVITRPRFQTAFGGLAGFIRGLRTGINSGGVTEVKVIWEQTHEFIDSFIDVIEESCYIFTNDNMLEAITADFYKQVETYVQLLRQKNRANAAVFNCANRNQILRAVNDAVAAGTFSPKNFIFGISAFAEFSALKQSMTTLTRNVRNGRVPEIKNIHEMTNGFQTSFLTTLSSCYIGIGGDAMKNTEDYFNKRYKNWVKTYEKKNGAPLAKCPKRGLIQTKLDAGVTAGYVDTTAIIETRALSTEFGRMNNAQMAMIRNIRNGLVADANAIVNAVNGFRSTFLNTLQEFCLIRVDSTLYDLITSDFDDLVGFYCGLSV